jgi:hypothetical protein
MLAPSSLYFTEHEPKSSGMSITSPTKTLARPWRLPP